ncbi:hypothetical protein DEJ03_09940 [Curtobacterium sp. MCLR17_043]|uniref:hypothetical protein n=1 Tax=Curtobacterium sp. MCLR17_034 TaxID=2175623 RepID=UPI000D87E7D7|nr:hypothetical protein [Curtobacterium sp. MCLR17_034]PYY45691.1 hypothetical protein DEJ03_09940 [Curtobacterium sp. MCLR17_043]PZF06886.1 hypothetical protein DEI98_17390 [Curtobacterium sp. MCLR17_034]
MSMNLKLAPVPEVLTFRTSAQRPDESDVIRRRAAAGELTRVARGLYAESAGWAALRPSEQHHVRLRSFADRIRPGDLISHVSAAVVFGVPLLTPPPTRIHVTSRGADRRTTNATFVVHADLDAERNERPVATPDGLLLCGLDRLATDLALTLPFTDAVVSLDALLRREVEREDVRSAIERRGQKGRRRALRAIGFADAASDSPGESYARARFDQFGTPPPVLQHRFRAPGEPDIVVDFWFPDAGVVVEFDGAVKYRSSAYLRGRTPEEALFDEKIREDRLRTFPEVRTVVRLTWSDLRNEWVFRAKLRQAGVRMSR